MPLLRTAAVLAAATSLTPACVGETGPGAAVVDSAGIAIRTSTVTSAQIADLEITGPVLQLGAFDGEGPEVFGSVQDVAVHGDRFFVVDGVARRIEAFGGDRAHLGTLGREGDGPGEYRSPGIIDVVDDSVLVWDRRSQRLSVFELEAGFVRSIQLRSDQPLGIPHLLGSGYVASRNVHSDAPPENTNGFVVIRDTTLVAAFDHAGESVANLIRVPGAESLESVTVLEDGAVQIRQGTLPFFRGAHFGVVDGEIAGGPNDRFQIHRWSPSGQLLAVHRYPNLDRPIAPADVAAYEAEVEEWLSGDPGMLRQVLDQFRAVDLPEIAPAFTDLLVSAGGQIWLREFAVAGAESWVVVDGRDGDVIGRVTFPDRFQLLSVGEGQAVGRWRDDYDVSYVQVYEIAHSEAH